MHLRLFRSAVAWTAFGLISGLFYREFTKLNDVAGGTQLALVHTHTLTLGTTLMLVLLALVGAWPALSSNAWFGRGFWVWQGGLALTSAGLLVKGSLQVLGRAAADSPALAGVSGLGHITLTLALIFAFVGLGQVIKAGSTTQSSRRMATSPDDAGSADDTSDTVGAADTSDAGDASTSPLPVGPRVGA